MSDRKIVMKPWGSEWWVSPMEAPYMLKVIKLRAGCCTSLQVHRHKEETLLITEGMGMLSLAPIPLDLDAYLEGKTSIEEVVATLEFNHIETNTCIHILPGQVHQIEAHTNITFVEASTSHPDDVIRILDPSGRGHGRIDAEHSK